MVPDSIFRRVASGGHPDLLTLERGFDEKRGKLREEIIVEDVRGVGNFLRLTPAEGGWRIVVVDAADDLNRNAANALLKILEEPPRQSLLLLICHAPGRLLPTIRSRCQVLAVRKLHDTRSSTCCSVTGETLGAKSKEILVKLAEGSIGRALDLAEAGGAALYRELVGLLASLPNLDIGAVHELGDRLRQDRCCRRLPHGHGSPRLVVGPACSRGGKRPAAARARRR